MKLYSIIALGVVIILVVSCGTGKTIIGGPISPDLKDGTYDGSAGNGPVKARVKVTIGDRKITDIDLIEHRTWKGGAAESVIPHRIIEAQSTKVDVVSGATRSSVAIMNAVEDAIQKAR